MLTETGRSMALSRTHRNPKPTEPRMPTLFHSPMTRSTRVLALIDEMGIADRIDLRPVSIPRVDGSGRRDPANPHPEGKVPALLDGDTLVTESVAVMVWLTTRFPDSGLAPRPDSRAWGSYLSWMAWYGAVMEPVLILDAAGVDHPYITASLRSAAEVSARLGAALSRGPWLMGEDFTAADLIVHSPYAFFPQATPEDQRIRDWVTRCQTRPATLRAKAIDADLMAAMVA
jgi:glutathione S-transferase